MHFGAIVLPPNMPSLARHDTYDTHTTHLQIILAKHFGRNLIVIAPPIMQSATRILKFPNITVLKYT